MIRLSSLARWADPALAFAVTIACLPFLPDGAEGTRWALLSVAAPAFLIARRIPVPTALLAVWGLMAITLAWSPDPVHGVDLLWQIMVLSMVALAAPDDLRPVFWAIGIALALNAALAMTQYDGWSPFPAVDRLSGLFFNRNRQDLMIALEVVALATMSDWRAVALAIFISIPLLMTPLDRTAIMALAGTALVAACARWRWLIPAALALAAGLALHLANDPIRSPALIARLSTWIGAAQHLTWQGHGLGAFAWQYPEMEYAHNDLLQIGYELGALGAVLAVGLVLYCLRSGSVAPRLILVAFMIEGLFDFPLYQPSTGFFAALVVGHLVRARARLCDDLDDRRWLRGLWARAPERA